MFDFLHKALRTQRQKGKSTRAAYDELVRQEADYQLRINELNRKIEKQQLRQQEILERGKREISELSRLGFAEQYARGERQVRRLLDRRKMLVRAQELIEVQLADLDLQDAIPQDLLALNRPEAHRERAMADVIRERLDQAYDDMLASAETNTTNGHMDSHEKASIQAILDLFDRERDEEIRATLRAIEEDLGARVTETLFARSHQSASESEM